MKHTITQDQLKLLKNRMDWLIHTDQLTYQDMIKYILEASEIIDAIEKQPESDEFSQYIQRQIKILSHAGISQERGKIYRRIGIAYVEHLEGQVVQPQATPAQEEAELLEGMKK